MKYIVLGASGFIGKRLCETIVERKHDLRVIPRNMYSNFYALRAYLEGEKADYIINCAAYGNHYNQEENLYELYQANVMNPLTLLEASKSVDYKGLVLVGSSSEYGRPPMTEEAKPQTDTFYGASKVAQTYLARAYARQYKKNVLVVRPFSVYGPGEADFRFIPTVVRSIKENTTFNLVGAPTHDWIYIDDFVEGLLFAAQDPWFYEQLIVNIGTGKATSNQEVVDLLEKISQKKPLYNQVESLRSYDSAQWFDESILLANRGWWPQVSLEEGLKKTYDYY